MNTTTKPFGNGGEAARDTLNQASERIDEATRDARKVASEKIHEGAAYARQHAGEALETAQGLARSATRYAKDNPGQAILVAAAAGVLLGLFVRGRR